MEFFLKMYVAKAGLELGTLEHPLSNELQIYILFWPALE